MVLMSKWAYDEAMERSGLVKVVTQSKGWEGWKEWKKGEKGEGERENSENSENSQNTQSSQSSHVSPCDWEQAERKNESQDVKE